MFESRRTRYLSQLPVPFSWLRYRKLRHGTAAVAATTHAIHVPVVRPARLVVVEDVGAMTRPRQPALQRITTAVYLRRRVPALRTRIRPVQALNMLAPDLPT